MAIQETNVTVPDLALLGKYFQDHRPKLLNMVQRRSDPRLLRKREPADILQDAYIKAQQSWERFRPKLAESNDPSQVVYEWLYQLTLNCLFDDYDHWDTHRRDFRAEQPLPDDSAGAAEMRLVDNLTGPQHAAIHKEQREEVHRRFKEAMQQLKPEDREILYMRGIDELSHEGIARILEISPGAARVRYARAWRRFAELWRQLYGFKGWES